MNHDFPKKVRTATIGPKHSILVVEDDQQLADMLRQQFEKESYRVDICSDGGDASKCLQNGGYDIVLLDLELPTLDGLSILKKLRETNWGLPVLVLTARNHTEDCVICLDEGADEYVTKPVSPTELLARVRALLRRKSGMVLEVLKVGDLTLDRRTRNVERGTRHIDLTWREFAILEFLMLNCNVPLSRSDIMEKALHTPYDPFTNVVDVNLSRIRDKIDSASKKQLIITVRGVGYMMADN